MNHLEKFVMDGGAKSRKLLFCAGTSLLVFFGSFIAAHWPAFCACFGTLVGGLLGACTIYTGSNVGSRFVTAKALAAMPPAAPTEPAPEPEAQ